MVLIPVLCPHCQSDQVIKGGKTKTGKQRYKCQNTDCSHYSFQLDLTLSGQNIQTVLFTEVYLPASHPSADYPRSLHGR